MKRCAKCGLPKPLTDFHRVGPSSDRIRSRCISCVNVDNSDRRRRASGHQVRARRGTGCFLTSEKHVCGESPEVEIQGLHGAVIRVRLCAKHRHRLEQIIAEARRVTGRHGSPVRRFPHELRAAI